MDLTYAVFVTNFMLVTMGLLLLHVLKTYREMKEADVQIFFKSMPGFFDYDTPNNGLSQLWFVLKVQALLVLIYKVIKHGPLNTFVWILSAFIDPLYNIVLKLRLLVILKTTGAEDKVDSNEARRAVEDGSLWAEFCDGLKAAGEVVLNESRYVRSCEPSCWHARSRTNHCRRGAKRRALALGLLPDFLLALPHACPIPPAVAVAILR